mgnify:CR=1 FL=1
MQHFQRSVKTKKKKKKTTSNEQEETKKIRLLHIFSFYQQKKEIYLSFTVEQEETKNIDRLKD